MLRLIGELRMVHLLSWIIVAVSLLLIAVTIAETKVGVSTADTNQYLTVMESFAETGTPRLEAYREPAYQWVIYTAMRPFSNPAAGFDEEALVDAIARKVCGGTVGTCGNSLSQFTAGRDLLVSSPIAAGAEIVR